MMPANCSVDGCEHPARARGWCHAHYARWRRHGDPLGGRDAGVARKFYMDVVLHYQGDDCLLWPFGRDANGYGKLWGGRIMNYVSRMVCEEFNGPPPSPDHEAAHSCGKGSEGCVSRKHLSWKTHAENQSEMLVHGSSTRGVKNRHAKLTESQARDIFHLKGKMLQREIGALFGVDQRTVSKIHRLERWGWAHV